MAAKSAPEPATTIAGVMGADRHRLHDLWRDFVRGVEICRIDDLSSRLGEFALGLHRQIAIEEAMLFPLLERHHNQGECGRREDAEDERSCKG